MDAMYNQIGKSYGSRRVADARIAAVLHARLRDARRILNIGAGTGNYEPPDRDLVALEPSSVMLAQRSPGAYPALQGIAEQLPFPDNSFDRAMAVLSIHHWSDWRAGIREALRVSGGRLTLLTFIGFPTPFWLLDYFPEIAEMDRQSFPTPAQLEEAMGRLVIDTVEIPHDCSDGFLCAYWRRPLAYLDPAVRAGISSFSRIPDAAERMTALEADLRSGRWDARHGDLRARESMDYGYRVVSCGLS